jgi:hypothetical protein
MQDTTPDTPKTPEKKPEEAAPKKDKPVAEIGGRAGPEPTRYGDWENGGRCTDF